jgi:hypothetical protein
VTSRDVETIVRNVIVERALPFEMLTVAASQSVWDIQFRRATGGILSVTLPHGRPVSIRVGIQDRLEAELEG